jgi:hypothetical protein
MSSAEEIEPYLVYRVHGGGMECALWNLAEGPQALALFMSTERVAGYLQTAGLGAEWRVFHPSKNDLMEIFKQCHAGGIRYAVLDPDGREAKRMWDIGEIVSRDA